MKRVLTVTLNPAVDRMVEIPEFTAGKSYVKGPEHVSAGGKGINVSRALKCLNVPSMATGILGGCSGRVTILKMLRKERMAQDFYKFGGYSRTSLTVIDPVLGRATQILEEGPKITAEQLAGFKEKFQQQLPKSNYVAIAGRNARGVSDRFYAELISMAAQLQVPVLLDTHGPALAYGIKAGPAVVTPNLQEAQKVAGRRLSSHSDLKYALKFLADLGAQSAVITLGEDGAVGFSGGEMMFTEIPAIKPYNVVGCGDAFNAGLIAALLEGRGFALAMRSAAACATASALTVTPGNFEQEEYQRVFKRTKVRKF